MYLPHNRLCVPVVALLAVSLLISCEAPTPRQEELATGKQAIASESTLVSDSLPVPDERTAIVLAERALVKRYGGEIIDNQRPLTARLEGNTWVVTGTLPPNHLGGVAIAHVSRNSGRVIRLEHGL